MKILGELIEVKGPNIYIPWFHRVAPSLKSGTKVHCVLFPGPRPELYLSPFPTRSWPDLWRLECEFVDRRGLFAQLTNLLSRPDININILAHESLTLSYENVFHVTLICDMSGYGDARNPDGTSQTRAEDVRCRLQFLCDYLTIEMFEDIKFRLGQPQLFAIRLREMHSVGLLARRRRLPQIVLPVDRGHTSLPLDTWRQFCTQERMDSSGGITVTVASDTEERYVKLCAVPSTVDAFLISIRHTDKEGQISKFSNWLTDIKNAAPVNISCSYLRMQEAGGKAVWRALLETSAGAGELVRHGIRVEFENLKKELRDDRLELAFPKPITPEMEPNSLEPASLIASDEEFAAAS